MKTTTHWFTAVDSYPEYGPTHKIRVKAGLSHHSGNERPYFSVTAEIYSPGARDCEACGCLHDDVLKHWPQLAPVVALHLCDDNGTPMHAEANGWYQLAGFYGGAQQKYHAGNSKGHYGKEYRFPTPDECLASWADHVRVPIAEARALAEQWRCDDDPKTSRRLMAQWIEQQRERWQREASEAIALLDRLIPATV